MAMAHPQPGATSTTSSNASPPATPSTSSGRSSSRLASSATAVHPSILQPRVAVVLNVPQPWHPWLFALRLLSCLPAAWWGLPSALHLLLRLLPRHNQYLFVPRDGVDEVAASYALTEAALATIWVCLRCAIASFITI